MKKALIILFLIGVIFFITPFSITTNEIMEATVKNDIFEPDEKVMARVKETMSRMTLREKCAQMVTVHASGYKNKNDDDKLERMVKEGIGGVIFLTGKTKDQSDLITRLQANSKIPLLISADFERGLGMRLEDAVHFPHNMALAATGDPGLAYLAGKAIAVQSRLIGVHQNYAPMIDLNDHPDNPIVNVRAYSDDPGMTSEFARNFIRGTHEGGALTCIKHFPGHGTTDVDSHKEMPVIRKSIEDLEEYDIIPYREGMEEGAASVMVGHLSYPELDDEDIPATLSSKIVNDLLKVRLGFTGLVITDAMNMHAVAHNFDEVDAVKRAVKAGNDVILFPVDGETAIETIYGTVKSGEISEARIDESVIKILKAKEWLGLKPHEKVTSQKIKKSRERKYERLAFEIAEKGLTLLRDEKGLIPALPGKYKKAAIISVLDTRTVRPKYMTFEKKALEDYPDAEKISITMRSNKKQYNKALKTAKASDIIFMPVYLTTKSWKGTIRMDEDQAKFVKDLVETGKPVVAVALGSPYLANEIPEEASLICAYSDVVISQQAAWDAIAGRIPLTGKLSVEIEDSDFERGFGLTRYPFEYGVKADTLHDFSAAEAKMKEGVAEGVFPGGVLLVGKGDRVIYHKAFGSFTREKDAPEMTVNTVFDLASLTKVVGATSGAMILSERGELDLDVKVVTYLPEFAGPGKENITVRNLLVHNSGLPAFKKYHEMYKWREEVIEDILKTAPEQAPGKKYVYSDLGIIILQMVMEKITGKPLDMFLKEEVFDKLGMNSTMYNPPDSLADKCAPTEADNYWRNRLVQGKVHDETTYLLGGVAGHAGLFSTSSDLAKFAIMMMNGGSYGDTELIKPEILAEWTKVQSGQSSRALGWDTNVKHETAGGPALSETAFGHTGFTGTSIWFDKDKDLFIILLTNRVNPSRDNLKIIPFRPELHKAVLKGIEYGM